MNSSREPGTIPLFYCPSETRQGSFIVDGETVCYWVMIMKKKHNHTRVLIFPPNAVLVTARFMASFIRPAGSASSSVVFFLRHISTAFVI